MDRANVQHVQRNRPNLGKYRIRTSWPWRSSWRFLQVLREGYQGMVRINGCYATQKWGNLPKTCINIQYAYNCSGRTFYVVFCFLRILGKWNLALIAEWSECVDLSEFLFVGVHLIYQFVGPAVHELLEAEPTRPIEEWEDEEKLLEKLVCVIMKDGMCYEC